jgi:hypothetical protein
MSRISVNDAKQLAKELLIEQLNYMVLFWAEDGQFQYMENDEYLLIKHEVSLLADRIKKKLGVK